MNRFPTKINSLTHLKSFFNDEIKTIIDVGILTGTEELIKVFHDSKHILVEPVSEFYETIERNYQKAGINYNLLKLALSNKKGVQEIQKRIHLPGLGEKYRVTASDLIFDDSSNINRESGDIVEVPTDTLDSLLSEYEGPFLVKIDVDGAELKILEGLTQCNMVYIVVVESWTRRLGEFLDIFKQKGFQLWDIVDLCYMRGQLSQCDLIFINNRVLYNERYKELTPRKFGFSTAEKGNYYALVEKNLFNDDFLVGKLKSISLTGKLE